MKTETQQYKLNFLNLKILIAKDAKKKMTMNLIFKIQLLLNKIAKTNNNNKMMILKKKKL